MFEYWKVKWAVVIIAALSSGLLVSQAHADDQKYCVVVGGIVDKNQCYVQKKRENGYYKVSERGIVTEQWSRNINGHS